MKAALIALPLLLLAAMPAEAERRCGWVSNPTPANWWLRDRQGEWVMGLQGGYQAPGMDNIPDLSSPPGQWRRTNGDYGYGCGCIDGAFARGRVTRIDRYTRRTLAQCTADRTLRRP